MRPTIIEGDRLLVNKMAYDIRVPFTTISLLKISDPQRGDVALFDSEVSGKLLVKRVVGLPGDVIAMRNNRLTINGQPLGYSADGADVIEHLPDAAHHVRWLRRQSAYGSFSEVEVPAGHYLMLGDNRDNSADSRAIGFVPRIEFVGRSRAIAFSLDYENFFLPRRERFFRPLDAI